MHYNTYLSVLLMAATCCSLILCYLCWKRREIPIAISYGLGMLTGSFYSLGYAFEIVSTDLNQILFWLKIEYIGIPFGTVMWSIMVLQYTGRQWLIRKPVVALLMVVPIITFVAHYTNEWHHLFYKTMSINYSQGFPLVVLVKGPLYQLHVWYAYILFAIGMTLLVQMYWKAETQMRKQITLMIIGSWGPYGFTIVYLSGIWNMPIDLSPFGFLFSGLFFMWGIYQFNLMRLAPLVLQKVFESMQDAVILLDVDNGISRFNMSASQVVKDLNYKGVIGKPVTEVLAHYPRLLKIITQEPPSSASKVQISGLHDDKFYNVHLSLVCNSNQKPVGKMLLLSDVTETVLTEERLRDNARQLGELNTFKDKMFNVVAHDIRDPLAVLVNLMELMEEEIETNSEDQEEIMQEMGRQIHNTFTLVESLLDWFRSQRGGMIFNPVVWDLSHVVQTNIQQLQVRSEGKRIKVVADIPKGSHIYADKEMLDLIIRNLLSNAIKFTGEGGNIQIKAEAVEGKVIVSVSDSGEGIQAEQAATLLQEDYPISSAGTAGERGVGLGLTLCREFVRLNGGELWFESVHSQGSAFYFSIPTPPNEPFVFNEQKERRSMA
ncbi:sensor histidine kinase [Cohnella abietis]|uniref:histidine kinase n=1 Tax=Cohnella abietis TaxID=2507935 RepID=A0A3T1DEE7_9BACL|nr:histidine kinase N-terminal 7TM domain-containing protein [Cohnella abietis]BBI36463.1 two-component sensor histidine kinase [Cohnella abietis]